MDKDQRDQARGLEQGQGKTPTWISR
jgi:hypothetical protein